MVYCCDFGTLLQGKIGIKLLSISSSNTNGPFTLALNERKHELFP